jgi:hypothetical protein
VALDTSQEALDRQLEAYRRMDGPARVEIAALLSDDVRELAAAGIQSRHPEYSKDQAHLALYRLLYGDDLFRGTWPNRPLLDP